MSSKLSPIICVIWCQNVINYLKQYGGYSMVKPPQNVHAYLIEDAACTFRKLENLT